MRPAENQTLQTPLKRKTKRIFVNIETTFLNHLKNRNALYIGDVIERLN